jgi:phosphocarrier protein HPr
VKEKHLIQKVRVKNELGLHTRPATLIVKLLQDAKSEVFFTYKKETINAKSILSILILGAPKNASITIQVKGEDAKTTMDLLVENFENGFGEGDSPKKSLLEGT